MTAPKPRLRDVEARAEAATEGPWEPFIRDCDYHIDGQEGHVALIGRQSWPSVQDDAHFIAASRTDVPALTAAIRAVLELADSIGVMSDPYSRDVTLKIRAALSAHIDLDES